MNDHSGLLNSMASGQTSASAELLQQLASEGTGLGAGGLRTASLPRRTVDQRQQTTMQFIQRASGSTHMRDTAKLQALLDSAAGGHMVYHSPLMEAVTTTTAPAQGLTSNYTNVCLASFGSGVGSSVSDPRSSTYMSAQPVSADSSSASITNFAPGIYNLDSSSMAYETNNSFSAQAHTGYLLQDDNQAYVCTQLYPMRPSPADRLFSQAPMSTPALGAAYGGGAALHMSGPASADNLVQGPLQDSQGMELPNLQHEPQWISPKVVDGQVVGYDLMSPHQNPVPVTAATSMTASLYVKGLPPDINELTLYQKFAPFGALLSCKIPKDGDGRCKGVAFVNYADRQAAIQAMQALHGQKITDRKTLHVTLQVPRLGSNAHQHGPSPRGGNSSGGPAGSSHGGGNRTSAPAGRAANASSQLSQFSQLSQLNQLRVVQYGAGGAVNMGILRPGMGYSVVQRQNNNSGGAVPP